MSETVIINESSNEIFSINKKNLKYITLAFCYVFIAFYFLINGRAIFPNWTATDTNTILIYFVGVIAFFTIAMSFGSKLKLSYQSKTIDAITNFALSFPIFWVFFLVIKDAGFLFNNVLPLPVILVIPTIVFQVIIVASSEEFIFRGTVFPLLAKINVPIAFFLTSLFFAIFHFAAYGGNFGSILFVLLIGMLMNILYIKFNIGTSIAFHGVYNLMVLGALVI